MLKFNELPRPPNLYPICDMDGRLPSLSDFTNWYISSSILTHNRRKKAVISSFISTLKKCLRNNCWNSISTLLIMTLSMLVIRLSSSKIHQFIYLHFEKAKEHNSLWKKSKKIFAHFQTFSVFKKRNSTLHLQSWHFVPHGNCLGFNWLRDRKIKSSFLVLKSLERDKFQVVCNTINCC